MNNPVYAFGFDSADPDLIVKWIDAGHLPNFRRLKDSGAFTWLDSKVRHLDQMIDHGSTDSSWVMFQTGVASNTSGFWDAVEYDKDKYSCQIDQRHGGYDNITFDPFYSLDSDCRVATFDIPYANVCRSVKGLQLTGWGGHFPFVDRASSPEGLLEEINQRYGENNILYKDYGVFWNRDYLEWLEKATIKSIRARTRICQDLMHRDAWDLFIAVYGEPHGAAHDLWFASDQSHPLSHVWKKEHDPLLSVYKEIDQSLGQLMSEMPPSANIICFSVHGMQHNTADLGSLFFLPELLYRFNFPSRCGFANDSIDSPLTAPYTSGKHCYWFGEIWRRRHSRSWLVRQLRKLLPAWLIWPPGKDFLFPYFLDWFGAQAGWIPAVWYQPAWPRMRSFAIPSYSDGHVRINLRGRESNGIVPVNEYQDECKRITEFLLSVTNPRTGESVVKQVVPTRADPLDPNRHLLHADLAVVWKDQPFDVVDSNVVGRIGPVPYYRTGGHRNCGFMIAGGPDVAAHHVSDNGSILDLAPTILSLMGAPLPDHLEGKTLLNAPKMESGKSTIVR